MNAVNINTVYYLQSDSCCSAVITSFITLVSRSAWTAPTYRHLMEFAGNHLMLQASNHKL